MSITLRVWCCVSIALFWLAYQFAHKIWRRNLVGAPLLLSELDKKTKTNVWMTKCGEVLGAGYKMLRDGLPMFCVTVDDGSEVLILNDRYLKELKALPDSVLDLAAAIDSNLLAEYSHVKVTGPTGQHAIRSDLTPGLSRLMPSIASEAVFALKHHFPWESDNWTPIVAFEPALNAVAQVSARLFVGEELCRDPRWLRSSKASTMMAFATIPVMKRWPGWMRPFVYRFVREARELERARAEAKGLLKEAAKAHPERGLGDPEDFLAHWVLSKNPGWAQDYDAQVDLQLELSVAAIHTTTNAFTHMLFDLAAHSECIQMLRDEINTALAKSLGEYNKECIASLVRTDSFMKESQRLHPPAHTTFQRLVMRNTTLPDDTFLPKGARIEIAASPTYNDPAIWDSPDEFDALRFMRLREKGQEKSSHQFVTANPDYIV